MTLTPIAHIQSPFREKFAIPRQSNIIADVHSTIVFTPPFRNADALRGIDGFDYIWLLWQFSENCRQDWSPTVRPPRLGGNIRMGVFATRSSFRPNGLALSSVRLVSVTWQSSQGPLLTVAGADLLDGTPIFDIKPYIPYTDAHPDARSGFAADKPMPRLEVCCPEGLLGVVPLRLRKPLLNALALDPRPAYQDDPQRVYGFHFDDFDIRFRVAEGTLSVVDIISLPTQQMQSVK